MIKQKFSVIGKIVNAFDTDRMNIYRNITIENPDGSTGESLSPVPIFEDVPCHLTFKRIDNPDAKTVDTIPVIVVLIVHCSINVDLENGDYLVVKRMGDNGRVLETYKGNIGMPAVSIGRQQVMLLVKENV